MKEVRCVVACHDANGEPNFFFCVVKISEEEYENGVHYDMAAEAAEADGYEGPFVIYDENDPPGEWLFAHFAWESVKP